MTGGLEDMPEDVIVELRFPARPDRMTLVRSTVRNAANFCGLDPTSIQELVLAVGEACQNVMQHGYGDLETGDILLTLSRDEDGIIVRIIDFAPAVDPKKIKPRDLSDVRPGGLGVHFIEELMDSAEFRPNPDGVGNVLEMTKRMEISH